MDILAPQLSKFLENLIPPRAPELQKMEAYAEERDFPIIGPICGHLCYQIAKTLGAKRIFEMGSGYGYSTAWFARAVQENGGGEVCHVVWDEELSNKARVHLKALGFDTVVKYVIGEAIQTLRIWPRNGTLNSLASSCPPPRPKISMRVPSGNSR